MIVICEVNIFMYACVAVCGTGFLFRHFAPWAFSMLFLSLFSPSILQICDFLPRFQRTQLPPDRKREQWLQSHTWEDMSEAYIRRLYHGRPTTENTLFASSIPITSPLISVPTAADLYFALFSLLPLGEYPQNCALHILWSIIGKEIAEFLQI